MGDSSGLFRGTLAGTFKITLTGLTGIFESIPGSVSTFKSTSTGRQIKGSGKIKVVIK